LGKAARLEHIRRELARGGEVEIADLAGRLAVSEMTIRRDLDVLAAGGEVMRTHGGAASARRLTFEFRFRERQLAHLPAKRAIAAAAVRHVPDGATVILDTGTTTLEIARRLGGRQNITVITTSLAIVSELQFARGVRLVLLGGYLREGSPDLHGPLTERNLAGLRASVAFLGADAIDGTGAAYTDDLAVASLDMAMAEVSKRTIVVADSSKFDRQAMCKTVGPGYDLLITDNAVGPSRLRDLRRAGVRVEVVAVGGELERSE